MSSAQNLQIELFQIGHEFCHIISHLIPDVGFPIAWMLHNLKADSVLSTTKCWLRSANVSVVLFAVLENRAQISQFDQKWHFMGRFYKGLQTAWMLYKFTEETVLLHSKLRWWSSIFFCEQLGNRANFAEGDTKFVICILCRPPKCCNFTQVQCGDSLLSHKELCLSSDNFCLLFFAEENETWVDFFYNKTSIIECLFQHVWLQNASILVNF